MKSSNTFAKRWAGCLALCGVAGFLAGGCGTVDRYFPDTIGPVGVSSSDMDLQLSIRPEKSEVAWGDSVVFTVSLSNVSARSFFVVKNPDMFFSWIYPTGSRDNFLVTVPPRKHYEDEELVELKPGDTHQVRVLISTYYFPSTGITEFRAVYKVPSNANPAITNFGPARAVSNRYGVLIAKRKS